MKKIKDLLRPVKNFLFQIKNTYNHCSIEVSSICDAKCIFCSYPNKKLNEDNLTLLNESTFKKILSYLKRTNVQNVSMTPLSGEFFVNKNSLSYLIYL